MRRGKAPKTYPIKDIIDFGWLGNSCHLLRQAPIFQNSVGRLPERPSELVAMEESWKCSTEM